MTEHHRRTRTTCPNHWKLVGDKVYISKKLFKKLFVDGIQLMTKLKSNIKSALMSVSGRLPLRKRAIIETVNDELKSIAQLEHSGHRAFHNFVVNLLSGLRLIVSFQRSRFSTLKESLIINLL
jgi:hypothetical protein